MLLESPDTEEAADQDPRREPGAEEEEEAASDAAPAAGGLRLKWARSVLLVPRWCCCCCGCWCGCWCAIRFSGEEEREETNGGPTPRSPAVGARCGTRQTRRRPKTRQTGGM